MLHHNGKTFPLLGLLCLLLNNAAAESPRIPALLGINLGSTDITAVTINSSGTHPLALVNGSRGYLDFMENTTNPNLPLEDYYDEAFNAIKEAIYGIRIEAGHNNGKDMRVGQVLAPEHFTVEMRRLVFRSWHAANDGIWGVPVRPVSYLAVAYPENDCVDRLNDPSWPLYEGGWVLTFHQDFDYLSVSSSEITSYIYDTMSQNIAMPASADEIVDFLRSTNEHEDRSKIASIVLSSHDGNTDFQVVKEALDKIDTQLWNRRKVSSLDLRYMAAAGAACMARQLEIFPVKDDECPSQLFVAEDEAADEEVGSVASALHAEL